MAKSHSQLVNLPGVWPLMNPLTVLSVRSEVGVSLLLAPTRADKRGPFSSSGKCRNTAGDSQESTCRSSGRSRVLLKALPELFLLQAS